MGKIIALRDSLANVVVCQKETTRLKIKAMELVTKAQKPCYSTFVASSGTVTS
jgi:hypothetical protein